MMKLFDSHCHLEDPAYDGDRDDVVMRARQAGVAGLMIVGSGVSGSQRAVALAESLAEGYASVGLHPHDAKTGSQNSVEQLAQLAGNPIVKAWGEVGLDFNRMFSPVEAQEHWFRMQLERAVALGLPLIFHERDSSGRLLEILDEYADSALAGVVHCFSGTAAELRRYLDLGLHIGITGILTHKQRGMDLRKLVKAIPTNRLLVETDAPYLTPSPERNKLRRNEPALVRTVLLKLASVLQLDEGELSAAVWRNTCRLYRIEND